MKVAKDFAKRQAALAEDIPRPVLERLIKAMLPRQPVQVRRPDGGWASALARADGTPDSAPDSAVAVTPDRFAAPAMKKLKRRAASRRSATMSSNRRYEVINQYGYTNHRRSWRRAMVECILKCDNERDAARMMEENYRATHPKWADNGIDLTWVANEAGYVRLL